MQLIMQKYSTLQDIYAVADWLKLRLEKAADTIIQEMFYNCSSHNHYVVNIFVFAQNGCVIYCVINISKSVHGSYIVD